MLGEFVPIDPVVGKHQNPARPKRNGDITREALHMLWREVVENFGDHERVIYHVRETAWQDQPCWAGALGWAERLGGCTLPPRSRLAVINSRVGDHRRRGFRQPRTDQLLHPSSNERQLSHPIAAAVTQPQPCTSARHAPKRRAGGVAPLTRGPAHAVPCARGTRLASWKAHMGRGHTP